MSGFFNSSEELSEKFSFNTNDHYYDKRLSEGSKIGFSVKRKYPQNIAYKPTVTELGEPNNVAIIWVTYLLPSKTNENLALSKVPIKIKIVNMDLYLANHFDYDFSDKNSPTKKSIDESKNTHQPITIESIDEYFFDHKKNTFIDKKGSSIEAIAMLDKLFGIHANTAHSIKGIPIRSKLRIRNEIIDFLLICINFLKKSLNFFGRSLQEDEYDFGFSVYSVSQLRQLKTDNLEVFGYKAAIGTMSVALVLICIISFLFNSSDSQYFGKILQNESLIIIHSIIIFLLVDFLIPRLVFWMMNGLIKIRKFFIFKAINL